MELREDKCRTCQAPITWVTTEKGKRMPLDLAAEKRVVINPAWKDGESPINPDVRLGVVMDTYVSHYSTCPQAGKWRGQKRS